MIAYCMLKKGKESTISLQGLFSLEMLDQIGLDDPFANQLKKSF